VLHRKDWTNRVNFWHGGFLPPIPHCVVRKFAYLQKLGYFRLGLCSKSGLRKLRHGKYIARCQQNSLSSLSTVELDDDTYTTVAESWLFTTQFDLL